MESSYLIPVGLARVRPDLRSEATNMQQKYCAVDGVILDVDGVIWIAGALQEEAIALLEGLRQAEIPFCLLTNDCSVSKVERQDALIRAGLILQPDQLVTAAEVTREWLNREAIHAIMYLGNPRTLPDIAKGVLVRESGAVNAVVVGDLFDHYDRHSLHKAARAIVEGATLVAMQSNPRWSDGKNWYVDNGFWIAGFEYVTGRQAVVMGKPGQHAYLTAVARLGLAAYDLSRIAFVSDDITNDLKGAKKIGLATIYFGPAQTMAPWVDHAVCDMHGLFSLLIGRNHD
jgi:HAD superfamily hydrolase (TIGR01450 family)